MRMRFLAGLLLIALPYSTARNAAPPPSAEPQLWWDAPRGARQGSCFDVEVPGKTLAGAMAAWFDCSELRATIRKVEEVTPEPPPGALARKERTEEGPAPRSTGLLYVEVDRAAVMRGAFLGAACDLMAAPDPFPEGFQVEELSLLKTLAP